MKSSDFTQAEGHRILMFSQWTKVLDILEEFLAPLLIRLVNARVTGHADAEANCPRYMRLDGSTAVQERQAMIDEFNKDVGISVPNHTPIP
ncbi:hypothetical protein T484DRAFT_1854812 [Baffinella frigidus]|nr:hypothetical protein T484DRAFT_1854812 [Cryptophyta sp. CCMP2293]